MVVSTRRRVFASRWRVSDTTSEATYSLIRPRMSSRKVSGRSNHNARAIPSRREPSYGETLQAKASWSAMPRPITFGCTSVVICCATWDWANRTDSAACNAAAGGYQVVCVNTSKEVSTDDGCRDESAGAGRAGAGDGGGAGRGGQVGPGRFAGRVDGPSRRGLIAIDRGGRVFAGAGEAGVGGGPGCGADRPSGL